MSDSVMNVIAGAVLAALTSAVAWLLAKVIRNAEHLLKQEGHVALLKSELAALKAGAITKECVGEVIGEALERRDEVLALRIEKAVSAGVMECHQHTKSELESVVPRIVREVLSQTSRHGRAPRADGADG